MTSSIETKRLHSTYYGGDVCCLYVIVRLRERDSGTLVNKENIDTFRYLHRIANQYNIHQRRWKRKHNAIQRTMMTSRMIGISRKSTSSLLTTNHPTVHISLYIREHCLDQLSDSNPSSANKRECSPAIVE